MVPHAIYGPPPRGYGRLDAHWRPRADAEANPLERQFAALRRRERLRAMGPAGTVAPKGAASGRLPAWPGRRPPG